MAVSSKGSHLEETFCPDTCLRIGPDKPDKRIELYQMFCGTGADKLQHVFLWLNLKTGRFRLIAFAHPKLSYDYADEEMTKLKSNPKRPTQTNRRATSSPKAATDARNGTNLPAITFG